MIVDLLVGEIVIFAVGANVFRSDGVIEGNAVDFVEGFKVVGSEDWEGLAVGILFEGLQVGIFVAEKVKGVDGLKDGDTDNVDFILGRTVPILDVGNTLNVGDVEGEQPKSGHKSNAVG
jgi:hypothetical protein